MNNIKLNHGAVLSSNDFISTASIQTKYISLRVDVLSFREKPEPPLSNLIDIGLDNNYTDVIYCTTNMEDDKVGFYSKAYYEMPGFPFRERMFVFFTDKYASTLINSPLDYKKYDDMTPQELQKARENTRNTLLEHFCEESSYYVELSEGKEYKPDRNLVLNELHYKDLFLSLDSQITGFNNTGIKQSWYDYNITNHKDIHMSFEQPTNEYTTINIPNNKPPRILLLMSEGFQNIVCNLDTFAQDTLDRIVHCATTRLKKDLHHSVDQNLELADSLYIANKEFGLDVVDTLENYLERVAGYNFLADDAFTYELTCDDKIYKHDMNIVSSLLYKTDLYNGDLQRIQKDIGSLSIEEFKTIYALPGFVAGTFYTPETRQQAASFLSKFMTDDFRLLYKSRSEQLRKKYANELPSSHYDDTKIENENDFDTLVEMLRTETTPYLLNVYTDRMKDFTVYNIAQIFCIQPTESIFFLMLKGAFVPYIGQLRNYWLLEHINSSTVQNAIKNGRLIVVPNKTREQMIKEASCKPVTTEYDVLFSQKKDKSKVWRLIYPNKEIQEPVNFENWYSRSY